MNWIKVRLIRQNETALYDELVVPVMREHLGVIEVIARRDPDGAVAALTRHINNARSRAMRIGRRAATKGEERMSITRRKFAAGTAAVAAAAVITRPARAQTVIRWGELLPTTHPQVQMIDRIAKEVKEKTSGRIEIQGFPNGQLGSGRDMIEAVASGALTLTTDGAAALGAVPAAALGDRGAVSLARRGAHGEGRRLADLRGAEQGPRREARHAHARRHLLRQAPSHHRAASRCERAADMAGFKLRVPPVDTFRAMAEAWGARATPVNFNELYLALSQGAVDGQENPLPTIQSAKLNEVQKFLVLTGHIITPRLVIVNEEFWKRLSDADRGILKTAIANGAAWQDKELAGAGRPARRHAAEGRHDGDRAGRRELPQAGARQGAGAVRGEVGQGHLGQAARSSEPRCDGAPCRPTGIALAHRTTRDACDASCRARRPADAGGRRARCWRCSLRGARRRLAPAQRSRSPGPTSWPRCFLVWAAARRLDRSRCATARISASPCFVDLLPVRARLKAEIAIQLCVVVVRRRCCCATASA